MEPVVHSIFEKQTSTWQYVVADPSTLTAVIIDPVLNFDSTQLTITTSSADELLELAASHKYTIVRLLETHAHADHLTAAYYIQQKLSTSTSTPKICAGQDMQKVQATFAQKYCIPQSELDNAFDYLFHDNETFQIGSLTAQVLHLPGHTPDHVGYMIGSNAFVGDSIFNPDVGSARCDFPNGDASVLYRSIQRLLSLESHYRLYTGHDYPPADSARGPVPCVTVAEQRAHNKHVKEGTREQEFVKWRQERDSGLAEPRLLHQALQVNIRGGRLPRCPGGGEQRAFFLVPVKVPGILAQKL